MPDPLDIYSLENKGHLYVHLFTQRYLSCAKKYVYESPNNYVFIPLIDEPYVRQRFDQDFRLHDRIFPLRIPNDIRVHKPSEYFFGEISNRKQYSLTQDVSYLKGFGNLSYKSMLSKHLKLPSETLDVFQSAYDLLPDAVYIRTYAAHSDYYKIKEFLENRFSQYFFEQGIKKKPPTVEVIGLENVHFVNSSGGKGFLHSNQEENAFSYLSNSLRKYLPQGYLVLAESGYKAILQAAESMRKQGITKTVIKPVFGSSGRGIFYLELEGDHYVLIDPKSGDKNYLVDYSFPHGDIVLEEYIHCPTLGEIFGDDLDDSIKGSQFSFSTDYMQGEVIANPTLQLLDGSEWVGNLLVDSSLEGFFQSKGISSSIFITMNHITYQYARDLGLSGPLCLDFLVDHSNNLFLIDPNNRDTGELGMRWITPYLSIEGQSILLFNFAIEKQLDLSDFVVHCSSLGINFEINYYIVGTISLLLYGDNYQTLFDSIPLIRGCVSKFYK